MGRGVLSAEVIRAQQMGIPMRTSDPADPEPYEPWVRTDLNGEADKVGELRWHDGSSTRYVWAMAVGTTPSGVHEYWRAQGPSGVMVFPTAPRPESDYPELAWEGPSGKVGAWSPPEPQVNTLQPTNVDNDRATLEGDLTELVHADSADVYFQWRQVGAASWNQTPMSTLSSPQAFDRLVDTLSEQTDYEYRAIAESGQRTADGGTVTFTTPSAIITVDDFEDGNMSEYYEYDSTGGSWVASTNRPHSGSYSAMYNVGDTSSRSRIISTGLSDTPQRGDTFEFYVYHQTYNVLFQLAFAAAESGGSLDRGYVCAINGGDNPQCYLTTAHGSATDRDQGSTPEDEWLRAEVGFHDPITMDVYDASGSLFRSVSISDNAYDAGSVALLGNGDADYSGNTICYVDDIKVTNRP